MNLLNKLCHHLRRLLDGISDCIWPRGVKCLCCDEAPEDGLLCAECSEQLKRLRIRHQHGDVRSVWLHRGCPRQLVLGLKYDCIEDCAGLLADGIADVAREMDLPPSTVITWVTMPEGRRRVRGIDHGRLLCEAVAERTGLHTEQLLKRTRRVRPQRGLPSAIRRRNLTGSFTCEKRIDIPVLLIDDVLTTGTTTKLCSDVLRAAGAPHVFILTATRAERDN